MSIGAPGFVYDFVLSLSSNPAGRAASVATETTTGATSSPAIMSNGSGSVATLIWSFSNFAPGDRLIFEVDVDPVSGNPTADARTVWFNNGAAPNASVQIQFQQRQPARSSRCRTSPARRPASPSYRRPLLSCWERGSR